MRVLELFSGTGSVSKVCDELNYDVVSVDITDKYMSLTHKVDILQWDYTIYPPGYFDIIWASPPCRTFSFLRNCLIGRKLKAHDKPLTMEIIYEDIEKEGLPLLRKAQEIIEYFKPNLWFIENPHGRMREFINDVKPHTISYCMYSDWGYRKNTDIWTNKEWKNPLKCNHKHHSVNCSKVPINLRYRVPPNLIKQLICP